MKRMLRIEIKLNFIQLETKRSYSQLVKNMGTRLSFKTLDTKENDGKSKRSKNTSIFRHFVITDINGPLSMARLCLSSAVGCYLKTVDRLLRRNRPYRGQLKIRLFQNFSSDLTLFSKFGFLALRLA